MDFLLEGFLQVFLQLVVDFVAELLLNYGFRTTSNVLRSRAGRLAIGAMFGGAFGYAWGRHLSGGDSWPKLLWVSIALAVAAAILAGYRSTHPAREDRAGLLRELIAPPWRWDAGRLVEFVVLNGAIAVGIVLGFDPGW